MIKILISTLISLVLLANSQIAFATAFEKKHQESSEKSLLQEAENSEEKCECEDADFANYEKNYPLNFNLFLSLLKIENEKIFADFSRSPASPPPDSYIS